MKVLKPNRLSCITRPYRYLNQNHLAITACVMVDFSSGCDLQTEQSLWRVFNEESIARFGSQALDFGIPKRRPEIILNAYGYGVYAVDGRAAVSVSVNNVRKDLWVTGDRYWSQGRPTSPTPFERIAISWQHAYGGEGYEENPSGKGFHVLDIDGVAVRPLPNIEDPSSPVVDSGKRYRPAGYSAISIEHPGRNRLLGTYDEQWRVEDYPGFARDINWDYFNQSPEGQRLAALRTGDKITFVHMHPEKASVATTVPPLVARAFVRRVQSAGAEAGSLEDVALRLTTYWAYPHLERAILLYQGSVPIEQDDASDVSHILYAVEHEDEPQPTAYYESVFQLRSDPVSGGLHALLDKQLIDARFLSASSADEIALSPLLRNKLTKLEKELAQHAPGAADEGLRSEHEVEVSAELAWLRKHRGGKIARDDVINELLADQAQRTTLRAARASLRRRSPPAARMGDSVPAATQDERRRFLAAQHARLIASLKEAAEEEVQAAGGGHAMAGEAAQASLQSLRLQQLDDFRQALDSAPGPVKSLRDYSGRPRTLCRIYGLSPRSTQSIAQVYDGYELHSFVADGASYKRWDLRRLTIRNSRMVACDLTQSNMAGCDFDGVVFQGCDFSNADWTQAHFHRCQFIDCNLSRVRCDKSRFERCRFLKSMLMEWMHFRITKKDCEFSQCRFINFSYMRGTLRDLVMEGCYFLRHAFMKGRIDDMRMLHCHLDSMSFVGVGTLTGLQMEGCHGSKLYVAPGTVMNRLEISRSTLSASSFRKTDLSHATIASSDLSTCDFSEASMRHSRIATSFFKQSLFIRTNLANAHVTNADFSEAQMKSADLTGADWQHVSFFSAELALIASDVNTRQHDLLMARSNRYPVRK